MEVFAALHERLEIVFEFITKVEAMAVEAKVQIPLQKPVVPVPKEDKLRIVLPLTVIVPDGADGKFIPLTNELPVVKPEVPPLILSAVVLPIMLFEIVMDAAIPAQLIPVTDPAIEAVAPEEVREPMLLLLITMLPVDVDAIPAINAPEVGLVTTMLFTPVPEPIVLPVTVPIFTFPAVT
jgi:hypothetical protein